VNEIIRQTPVKSGTKDLLVSTIKIAPGYYDTVVMDESDDQRHAGKILAGHEHEDHQHGPYVIGATSEHTASREAAMDRHREALYAARTEEPK
jgi:hypothetical protein